MNRFQLASIKEREYMTNLLRSKGIKDWQVTFTDEKSFKQYDGIYENSKGEMIMFEVKVRNVASNKYPTTVIEQSKYNFLIDAYRKEGVIPYIFIFFTDGKVLIQNLLSRTVVPKSMYAPKTTSGDTTKVLKHFMEIPIDDLNTHKFDYVNVN